MKNHKESLAVEKGCCSVETDRNGFATERKVYFSPSAEIIDICSESVFCASIPDLTNEDWN